MMRSPFLRPAMALALAAIVAAGCERSTDGLRPFPLSTDPVVFDDNFGAGVDFQAFLGSKLDAVGIDTNERHAGAASLKVTVPAAGDPSGGYAGGAFVANIERNLSGYDALTFWAKASQSITLDVAGLGNDNTGTSRYEARRGAIPITTTWTKFVVPIPLPARLAAERGLFFVAEGPEGGVGFDVWFDDVRFEATGAISNPRPSMTSRTLTSFVGGTVSPTGTQTIFGVGGGDVTVGHMPGYFDFNSSNPAVAISTNGTIRVTGAGTAAVTAQLGGIAATGTVTINAIAPPASPAPAPTVPAVDVISLFSNTYANVPVSTWSAAWDNADVTDLQVAGDDVKGYTNIVFAGIEFTSPPIDAMAMTHFHMDVFLPSGTMLRVKLVDFGPNGIFGGGDDKEHELTFNASTTPAVTPGIWSALEIPFADFTNLTTRADLAQIILAGTGTVFVDNVYFHR
jgi:hypothetical protein